MVTWNSCKWPLTLLKMEKKTHNIFSISLILHFFSKNLSLSLIKFKLTERTPFWFQFLCLQLLKFSPLFLDSQMCLLHLLRFFFFHLFGPYWSISRQPSNLCHLKIWLSSKTQVTCQFLIFPLTSAGSYHFFIWTLCNCFWIYKVAWFYWKRCLETWHPFSIFLRGISEGWPNQWTFISSLKIRFSDILFTNYVNSSKLFNLFMVEFNH